MKQTVTKYLLVCVAILFSSLTTIAQDLKALYYEKQEIPLKNFDANGYILDIGGGGEGVIGQLKGDQVISIDLSKQELVDAPSTNLKIVMDATDLKFIDHSFNTAAIFYTLMYIPGNLHDKVFSEVKRVLKHGGRLLIWDVNLLRNSDASKKYAVYPFLFKLPNKNINTGYGVRFPKNKDQNMQYYIELAKKAGFKLITANERSPSFYLEFKTPSAITDTLVKLIEKKGIENALKTYKKLKQNRYNEFYFGADVLITQSKQFISKNRFKEALALFKLAAEEYSVKEQQINSFGYRLLRKNRNFEAIEVFKINTIKYPKSANVYDSLAEAYMNNKQNDLAIKFYKKSLELDPNNANATKMLKKLSKK